MKKYHILFILLWLQACNHSQLTQTSISQNKRLWELNRLYFGRAMPNGQEVSEREWKRFLTDAVTPAFPEGLTMWHAEGQWQNDSGRVVRERTFVLEIAYLRDADKEKKIQTIVKKYRECFRQQSVMQVRAPVTVLF